MKNELTRLLTAVGSHLNASRFVVAYSGGVDSTVLLHQLAELKKQTSLPTICAIHVHHGLSQHADSWQAHCQKTCEQLGVEFKATAVSIPTDSKKSIEELAREARYHVFNEFLQKSDVLLMAHHQNDQAETLLLRLLRGAGPKGLAAMPVQRELGCAVLIRPLLNVTRDEIEQYATAHNLTWINDDSNDDTQFDRNFLRHEVLPIIKKKWPQYAQTWARSAQLCKEVDDLCSEWGWLDWQNVQGSKLGTLSVKALHQLSEVRQRNVIRYWLTQQNLPLPSQIQLQTLLSDVASAKEDAEPLLSWPGVEIRRYQDNVYAMQPLSLSAPLSLEWCLKTPLPLSVGVLNATQQKGEGVALSKITQAVTVRFRQGGERCKPVGRVGSHPLKKLFQEYNVEPWLRDVWPLIYVGEDLVAVPNLRVCDGFQTDAQQLGCMFNLTM
jgi:tRNA(Ile)-lysidine synthase